MCICLCLCSNLFCVCNHSQSSPRGEAFGKRKERFQKRGEDADTSERDWFVTYKESTLIKGRAKATEATFQNISWIVTEVPLPWMPAVLFTLYELYQKFLLKVLFFPTFPWSFCSACLMLCQHNLLPCVSSVLESASWPSEHFTLLNIPIKW